MNKLFISILLFFSYCAILLSQSNDYSFIHKQIKVSSKEKKYQINISYPQISVFQGNPRITSFYGFNTFVENQMKAERDSFIVWMNDWEINEHTKEFTSEYELGDSVYYADNKLISIQFYGYSYFAGAAHPNNWSFSINYDLENSKEIFLKDLLTAGWENKISEICIAEINKQKSEKDIEPSEWLKDGAGPKEDNFKVFNPIKEGLLITFPTYQVGAYVEGPSEVFIKYSEIKEIIKPKGLIGDIFKIKWFIVTFHLTSQLLISIR